MKEMILLFALLLLCTVVKAEDDSARIDISADITPDPDNSYLSISSIKTSPDPMIEFNVYRGKTLKRTLYIHIEDSSGKRISTQDKFSLPTRFKHYTFTSTLPLTKPCSPPHHIVMTGLDLDNKTLIDIQCPKTNQSSSSSQEGTAETGKESTSSHIIFKKEKFSFDIIDMPESISSGEPFKVKVLVENSVSDFMDIQVWSYVYRSSKSYSGERESNRKTINIPEYSNITFFLENTVDAPPGNYSYKLKLLLPDLKLPKELTKTITVLSSEDEKSLTISRKTQTDMLSLDDIDKKIISSKKVSSSNNSDELDDGSLAYLSSSAKAKRLIPLLVIVSLAALLIFLVMRNL